jgi:UDP-3-O-[3-hydroxymyristoyl] N-acetylglucosamine deacetylase
MSRVRRSFVSAEPGFVLRQWVSFEGLGVHTGQLGRVRVGPARSSGCWMASAGQRWPVRADYVVQLERCTVLGHQGVSVSTVEHLLSALAALNIYNCEIEVEGPEIPILDGSAKPFYEALLPAREEAAQLVPLVLQQPLWVGQGAYQVLALPAPRCSYTYCLHYAHPLLGYQEVTFIPGQQDYLEEIGLATTFALEAEVEALKKAGLALGGSLENALVIYPDRFSRPLRVVDEPVRHKCLDLMGDLYLLGRPLQARVLAVKAGHRGHVELAQRLLKEVSPC